jgi:hypothetical protein
MENTPPELVNLSISPSPVKKRHSKVGIASFIVGLLALMASYLPIEFSLPSWGLVFTATGRSLLWGLFFTALGLPLLGILLAIVSLSKKGKKKLFGVLGLLLSCLPLIFYLLAILGLYLPAKY